MSPISHERVQFCKDRLRVVIGMHRELTRQRQMFGASPQQIQSVMNQVLAEKLSLELEIDVLERAIGVAP